jgi:hypothetical protein
MCRIYLSGAAWGNEKSAHLRKAKAFEKLQEMRQLDASQILLQDPKELMHQNVLYVFCGSISHPVAAVRQPYRYSASHRHHARAAAKSFAGPDS